MRGATAGSKGVLSDSGWSNGNIFRQYLEQHFLPYVSSTLIDWAKTQNIILFVLPPHTIHLLQPLDVGIYGPFKNYYHSECSLSMKKNIKEVVNKYNMCELASKAYLKAMTPRLEDWPSRNQPFISRFRSMNPPRRQQQTSRRGNSLPHQS
jgi:hypothetical protein